MVAEVELDGFAEGALGVGEPESGIEADVDVDGGATRLESKLECEASLQVPAVGLSGGEPREQAAIGELAPQASDPSAALGPVAARLLLGDPLDA